MVSTGPFMTMKRLQATMTCRNSSELKNLPIFEVPKTDLGRRWRSEFQAESIKNYISLKVQIKRKKIASSEDTKRKSKKSLKSSGSRRSEVQWGRVVRPTSSWCTSWRPWCPQRPRAWRARPEAGVERPSGSRETWWSTWYERKTGLRPKIRI